MIGWTGGRCAAIGQRWRHQLLLGGVTVRLLRVADVLPESERRGARRGKCTGGYQLPPESDRYVGGGGDGAVQTLVEREGALQVIVDLYSVSNC